MECLKLIGDIESAREYIFFEKSGDRVAEAKAIHAAEMGDD